MSTTSVKDKIRIGSEITQGGQELKKELSTRKMTEAMENYMVEVADCLYVVSDA